ncbi:hypothetical protein CF327_g7822 [Tilletia walkeri]|nr:hypothetical protein CF327_g7822 [Tilletia walkeri]
MLIPAHHMAMQHENPSQDPRSIKSHLLASPAPGLKSANQPTPTLLPSSSTPHSSSKSSSSSPTMPLTIMLGRQDFKAGLCMARRGERIVPRTNRKEGQEERHYTASSSTTNRTHLRTSSCSRQGHHHHLKPR